MLVSDCTCNFTCMIFMYCKLCLVTESTFLLFINTVCIDNVAVDIRRYAEQLMDFKSRIFSFRTLVNH
jgi:hypothetical protein